MRMWQRQRGEVKTGVGTETGAFPFVPGSWGSRDGHGLGVVGSCRRSGQEEWTLPWPGRLAPHLGPNCPSCAWGCFYQPARTRAQIWRFWLKGSFPCFWYPSGTCEGGWWVGLQDRCGIYGRGTPNLVCEPLGDGRDPNAGRRLVVATAGYGDGAWRAIDVFTCTAPPPSTAFLDKLRLLLTKFGDLLALASPLKHEDAVETHPPAAKFWARAPFAACPLRCLVAEPGGRGAGAGTAARRARQRHPSPATGRAAASSPSNGPATADRTLFIFF